MIQNQLSQNSFYNGDKSWISFHIFIAEDLNNLLKRITPLILELTYKESISKYFFIKYNEGGPHLRLRFLVKNSERDNISEYAKCYINNSLRQYSDICLWWKDAWYTINTVHEIEYVPEIERYGGLYFITPAETHFMHSSNLALTTINSEKQYSYYGFFAIAITSHIVLIGNLLEKNLKEVIRFFHRLFEMHFSNVQNPNEIVYANEYRDKCKSYFDKQENVIVPFIKRKWQQLVDEELEGEVCQWNIDCKNLLELLKEREAIVKIERQGGEKFYLLKQIMVSYIHMTNNRLGISNMDEILMYFYIAEGLKAYDRQV